MISVAYFSSQVNATLLDGKDSVIPSFTLMTVVNFIKDLYDQYNKLIHRRYRRLSNEKEPGPLQYHPELV